MPTGDPTDVAYNPFARADLSAAPSQSIVIGTGTGTAYTVTATPAAVVLGTTSPVIVLPTAGTWLIQGTCHYTVTGATFAATKVITTKARRTNNTAADVTGCTQGLLALILTTTDQDMGVSVLPPALYTTANADDSLTLFSSVATIPSAGTLQAVDAAIWAIRLY